MSTLFKNILTVLGGESKPSPSRKQSKKDTKSTQKPSHTPQLAKSSPSTESASSEIIAFAREEADKIRDQARSEMRELQSSLKDLQSKLLRQQEDMRREQEAITRSKTSLSDERSKIDKTKEEIENIKRKQLEKLEKISSLTKDQAKEILLSSLDKYLAKDIAERIRVAEDQINEVADEKAREILVDAMYHGSTDYVAEYTVSTIKIPDEEVKGRIIGKEGRNIRAFEKITGVDLDLDETPGEIRLSCYDPVRREIARIALERLVKDGRIQPTRIEEYVEKAKKDIDKIVFEEGKKLCHAVGAYNVPHELIAYLGRFKYRSSYGQNMIQHTLEETKIGMKLASEVGVDVDTVRLGCLFHDIGKVIDEEGSHVELGVKLLKKFNVSPKVVTAVAEHHEDQEFSSLESMVVYISDAISGARPGARYENYDEYVKRLTQLEEISKSKHGVAEAYAIQAGREVRVIVSPEAVTDDEVVKLAHDIKEEIKSKVTYPGTVTVTVIRETRAQEVAK